MKTNDLYPLKNSPLSAWTSHIRFKPVETDSEAVYQALWDRICNEGPANQPFPPRSVSTFWKYLSLAASFALLLALSTIAYLYDKITVPEVSWIEVTAMPGSRTQVFLPDGTKVWLNAEATIRYPRLFTDPQRTVECNGEAIFEVQKDIRHPFIVRMEGINVQVLGTVFNIFNDTISQRIETTLLEGRVALFKDTNKTGRPDLILQPEQQAVFDKKSGKMAWSTVQTSLYTAWKDRRFSFERNTLEEIMTTLERAFRVKIHIDGRMLKNKRLTASFTHGEPLDEILSVLQISARYQYKKEKEIIYIIEK